MKKFLLTLIITFGLLATVWADVLILNDNSYLPNIVILKNSQGRIMFRLDNKNYSLSEKHIASIDKVAPAGAVAIVLDELRTYIKKEKEKEKQEASNTEKKEVDAQPQVITSQPVGNQVVESRQEISSQPEVNHVPNDKENVASVKGSVFWNWDYTYYVNGDRYSFKEFDELLQQVPEARLQFKQAKSLHPLAIILGAVSGFCVGYGLGPAINNQPINPTLVVAGSLGIVIDGILGHAIDRGVAQAVNTYNQHQVQDEDARGEQSVSPALIKTTLVELKF